MAINLRNFNSAAMQTPETRTQVSVHYYKPIAFLTYFFPIFLEAISNRNSHPSLIFIHIQYSKKRGCFTRVIPDEYCMNRVQLLIGEGSFIRIGELVIHPRSAWRLEMKICVHDDGAV